MILDYHSIIEFERIRLDFIIKYAIFSFTFAYELFFKNSWFQMQNFFLTEMSVKNLKGKGHKNGSKW